VRLSEIQAPRIIEDDDSSIYNDPLYVKYKQQIDFALDKYIKHGSAIYRGGNYPSISELYFRDPMTYPEQRKSANTANYYTLWMDSSPKWIKFPKRSRSLICSNNPEVANYFGILSVVVPTRNCIIGICPEDDLWNSFERTAKTQLNTFNDFLSRAFELNGYSGNPQNYEQLIQLLSKTQIEGADFDELTDYGPMRNDAVTKGGLLRYMDYVFDPVKNKFKLTNWSKYNLQNYKLEIWLNAPCVIVPFQLWETLVSLKHREAAGK